MIILAHPTSRGNPCGDARTRPDVPTLAQILADQSLHDGAKRVAHYLDGCCRADGRWAAWPKVSTIAHVLGWGGDPEASRKRVARAFRELIGAGFLARVRLARLVEWHDQRGEVEGLAWPGTLPRHLRRSAMICVLAWKLPPAAGGLPISPRCDIDGASAAPEARPPILPRWDIGVPPSAPEGGLPILPAWDIDGRPAAPEGGARTGPDVPYSGTPMSRDSGTPMSHPSLNVRRWKEKTTTDSTRPRACEGPGGHPGSSSSRSFEGPGEGEAGVPEVQAAPPTELAPPPPPAAISAALAPAPAPIVIVPAAVVAPRAEVGRAVPPSGPAPAPIATPSVAQAGALAPTLARAMARFQSEPPAASPEPGPAVGPPVEADRRAEAGPGEGLDLGRAALIAKVEELAPGPENREVRRAIYDAVPGLLKTAKLAGSATASDHVRMALEKASGSRKRRDTIESLARGIVKNWAEEGFPAVATPPPPARAKPPADIEADIRAAVERRQAEVREEAERRARQARWESLSGPERSEIVAEFERSEAGPAERVPARFREVQARDWWLARAVGLAIGGAP